jgi:hypothetical protein
MSVAGGRPPKGSSEAGSASSSRSIESTIKQSSNKSQKRNSTDSPCGSANNGHGLEMLYDNVRSVLSHPLGLALVCAFNADAISCASAVPKQITDFVQVCSRPNDGVQWDNVLENSVREWRADASKRDEKKLTGRISEIINNSSSTCIAAASEKEMRRIDENGQSKRFGALDIVVSPKLPGPVEQTPVAIMEFGLNMEEWWSKLDQLTIYLLRMCSNPEVGLHFRKPLLFAVATIDDNEEEFKLRLGVFLCTPKDPCHFRITLLWRSQTGTLKDSSNAFGKLLRVTSTFASFRATKTPFVYEYFSSNCCKIGSMVSFRGAIARER